ncbi:MAG: GxxExxY protein [Bacteroidaceae bacterium]|nr:GxxExxY protein [Bacteroidaceae bacterium]
MNYILKNSPKNYKDTVYTIIGAAMRVHSELGWGLLEPIYNEALHIELLDRGIGNEQEKLLPCYYRNQKMDKSYRMDIVVDDIIVELKSVREIIPAHRAQLFNYLRLTKKPIGLIINFGQQSLQGERYAFIEDTNECYLLDKDMNLLYPEYADEEGER